MTTGEFLDDVEFLNVSVETKDQLVDIYLRLIHDKPHTLFHPSHLKDRIRAESIPLAMLYAIMALAARYGIASSRFIITLLTRSADRLSDKADIRRKADSFFQTAKYLLKLGIDHVSLDVIQTSILVANLCGAEGDSQSEALFFGE
jgi:hypothetical protein